MAVFSAACSDDETTSPSTSSTTRTTTTTTTTTGPGSGGGGGSGIDCTMVCDDLWGCTQEGNNCPGLEPGDEMNFKMNCMDTCNGPTGAALAGLVDPMDCMGTVETISGLNMEFAAACQGAGGAGGGG
ncbi:MAG TPA: hypothetical protein VFB62_07580 [Polyangiaceae bacterium]|nr:hypothetical protein [Polyangiaceae bacterium]